MFFNEYFKNIQTMAIQFHLEKNIYKMTNKSYLKKRSIGKLDVLFEFVLDMFARNLSYPGSLNNLDCMTSHISKCTIL